MRKFKRLTMTLALLIAAVGGAWADEEPQLLTTINASSSFLTGSQTFDDIATVTFGGTGTVVFNNGWIQDEFDKEATVTVTAVDGYTITSIKLYDRNSNDATISTSPFTAYLNNWGTTYVTTGSGGAGDYVGDELTKIEVYGYQSEPEITEWELKPDDTGKNWILADMPASNIELQVEYYAESNLFLSKEALADKASIAVKAGDLGVQFGEDGKSANTVTEGTPMTVTYNGTKKLLGMKVEKKVENAYLKWDADQKKMVATEIPTTATKVENSTSYVEWSGTYVVEDDVTITGNITLSGNVNLIIKDGATLTANKIIGYNNNLSIYGQANQTGQLVVDNSGDDATTSIKTLEVHSAKVTATSSKKDRGGFYYTRTINVYGGSVDATAANGYGIWLTVDGSMNIYGGEVKAVGKGTGNDSYGIKAGGSATVTVNGGKLWAENANKQALHSNVTLKKGDGFTGKIEYSSDNSTWSETVDADAKYVRAGY